MKLAYCRLDGETGHEAGRRLLRELYRQETGEDLPPILTGQWGKPYFENSPWHFSISHTKGHAFCVLARQNVAIDAEELQRPVQLTLSKRVLSAPEMAQFEAVLDQKRALLTFWILKEARAKLSGKGMQGGFRDTEFTLDDPRIQEIDGCIVAVMKE